MNTQIMEKIFEKRKAKLGLQAWIKAYLAEFIPQAEDEKISIAAMKNAVSKLEI